jgi:hypothetical protein
MSLTPALSTQLGRLTRREKAALADHLWRQAEGFSPTSDQLLKLRLRAESALAHPERLNPVGDAVRRLKR